MSAKTVLSYLWSLADVNDELPADYAPTRAEIVAACLAMEPRDALQVTNGAQMRMVATPIINAIRPTEDAEPILLKKDAFGRVGAGAGRVSIYAQRSKKRNSAAHLPDIGQNEEAVTREFMVGKKLDTHYSEEEQFGRLVDHFTALGESFYLVNDSGCSGSWPWDKQELIDKLHVGRAVRYSRVFTQLVLESQRPIFQSQREAAENYLRERLEKSLAPVENLPPGFAKKYLGKSDVEKRAKSNYPKYRPGITVIVRRFETTHSIVASDLSRLFRSYDLQLAFAELLVEAYNLSGRTIEIIGKMEPLDFLTRNAATGTNMGHDLQGMVLGKMAEGKLYEVLSGAIRGQLMRLEGGDAINCDAAWLDSTTKLDLRKIPYDPAAAKGGFLIKPEGATLVMAAIELWETGLGASAIITRLLAAGYCNVPTSTTTIHNWVHNPALVGDAKCYGMVFPNIVPALLIDAEGNPDRLRFERINNRLRKADLPSPLRLTAETDAPPRKGHLGAAIATCVCRQKLIWRIGSIRRKTNKSGEDRVYVAANCYRCRCVAAKKRSYPYHVLLGEANFHRFLTMMCFDDIEHLIAQLSNDRERDMLAEKVLEFRNDLGAVRAEINKQRSSTAIRALAEARAQQGAAQMGIEVTPALIEQVLTAMLKALLERERQAADQLDRGESRLRAYQLPTEWLKLKARLEAVSLAKSSPDRAEPSEEELNEIVQKLLKLEFSFDTDGELQCHLIWLLSPDRRAEVPLSVRVYPSGNRRIQLPETPAEMLPQIL